VTSPAGGGRGWTEGITILPLPPPEGDIFRRLHACSKKILILLLSKLNLIKPGFSKKGNKICPKKTTFAVSSKYIFFCIV
jgi:hypothetical protein